MTKSKEKLHEAMADAIAEEPEALPLPAPVHPSTEQTGATTQAGTSLYQKMTAVMGKLERLPKSGWNSFHKYHYVTDADVMDVLRVNLAEVGVAFLPNIVNVVRDTNRVTVEIALTLTDADTGEMITATWFGEANDRKGTDDKAIQKAVTAAVKYFLLKTFLIGTGDEAQDTDSGVGDARQAKIPSSPPPKPPPTRAALEERWEDLWQEAISLNLDPGSLPTVGPDNTDAELTAAGKKLVAIVEAARPKKTWDAEIIAAVLQAELSENSYSVVGTLKKSDLSPDAPTDVVVAWFRQYRASHDAEGSSDEAATVANTWLAGEVD